MIKQSQPIILIGVLMGLLVVAISWIGVDSAEAAPHTQSSNSCVIPASGPWPPCATGGQGSNNNNSCTIPPSGPWPACARNGGNGGGSAGGGGGNTGSCVIPTSGPWPACATSGGGSGSGGCVIPVSGPWPACAKNDDGTTSNNPTSGLVELTGRWQADIYPNAGWNGQSTWSEAVNVIDYDWGMRSPQPRIPNDNWSGIWYRRVTFDHPTRLRLVLNADDEAKATIQNQGRWVVELTANSTSGERTTDILVPAGESLFRVNYIEYGGNASLEFRTYVIAQVPAVSNPQVQIFDVPDTVIAGDTATILWRVTGVPDYARLTLVEQKNNGYSTSEIRRVVGPVDGLGFPTPSTSVEKRLVSYTYWLEYEGQKISAERTMQTDCTYQWFFFPANYSYANDDASRRHTWGQCPTRPDISQASMQRFDGGLMIWIANRDQILVYTSNSNTLSTFTDTFQAGVDPVRPTESQTPPAGKLVPEYGFGKLWGSNAAVRSALGWATSRPQNYLTVEQANETDFRNNRGFLRLADGNVMFTGGARGIMQTQSRFANINAFAHPNNGFRGPASNACAMPTSGPWPPCFR